jgi:carbon dioxide concentrating mechanism protein CcmO
MTPAPQTGVAVLEISALGAALVILDALEKAAGVRLLQAELNDFYGFVLKVTGDAASLRAAVGQAKTTAAELHAPLTCAILDRPAPQAWRAIEGPGEYQPLIEQDIVFMPADYHANSRERKLPMNPVSFAIGLIETQGFTAVLEAIDTACKAADVEVIGKEKLGGGYITVLIKGDVAAVTAAIEAGRVKVDGLGKLIAAHVIPRPSEAVLALLPKSSP